jgi:hypothetical protein
MPQKKPGGIDSGNGAHMSVFLLLFILLEGIRTQSLGSVELNGRSVRKIS